jgi:TonB family protein
MLTRMRPAVPLLLVGLFLAGCQSLGAEKPTNFELHQETTDAYVAFGDGNCARAMELTEPDRLRGWERNEIFFSMRLLRGFCQELAGDLEAARTIYLQLVEEAPETFAARDAKERARIIRINESDPSHAAWMRDARDRALEQQAHQNTREPLNRKPARFPPVARSTGIEGYAVVEFGVTPKGKTSDPIVIESQPPLLFDGTALRAVRSWEYASRRGAKEIDVQVIRLVFIGDQPAEAPAETDAMNESAGQSDEAEQDL